MSDSARTAQAWSMQSERIIRLKMVLARTGLSRSTIYRMIKIGTFPRQICIGVRGAGWHESEINRWIANPAGYRPDQSGEERDDRASFGTDLCARQ